MDFIKYLFAEFERLLYFGVESESEPETEPQPEPQPESESEPQPEPQPEIIDLQDKPPDDTEGLQQRSSYIVCDNV